MSQDQIVAGLLVLFLFVSALCLKWYGLKKVVNKKYYILKNVAIFSTALSASIILIFTHTQTNYFGSRIAYGDFRNRHNFTNLFEFFLYWICTLIAVGALFLALYWSFLEKYVKTLIEGKEHFLWGIALAAHYIAMFLLIIIFFIKQPMQQSDSIEQESPDSPARIRKPARVSPVFLSDIGLDDVS